MDEVINELGVYNDWDGLIVHDQRFERSICVRSKRGFFSEWQLMTSIARTGSALGHFAVNLSWTRGVAKY